MKYVCGWDGGGTKTEVLCVNELGDVLANESFGPLNINGVGRDVVAKSVKDCVAFMASLPGGLDACQALVIGVAGVSNVEVSGFITGCVRACGYTGRLDLQGDQDIALAGAVEGPGAVLVAGTGSVCCGRDENGVKGRAGGRGHLIDDEGSGYAIGRDILRAVVRADDGRIPPTVLTAMVYEQLGVSSIPQIITWLYSPDTGKKDVAALTPLLLRALDLDDHAARAIAHKAASELSQLACALWKTLHLDHGELALVGSILTRCEVIREEVKALCTAQHPHMDVRFARGTPAQGAAQLALMMKE